MEVRSSIQERRRGARFCCFVVGLDPLGELGGYRGSFGVG